MSDENNNYQNTANRKNKIIKIEAISIVNLGLEEIAKEELLEIAELDKKQIIVNATALKFDCKNYEELFKIIYRTQSSNRILFLIDIIKFKDDENLLDNIKKSLEKTQIIEKINLFLKNKLENTTTFRVSCNTLHHLEAEIGEILLEKFKDKLKVNLKEYELNFYVHIYENSAYIGIDFSEELSKRDYKIFNSPMSLKGTTAFGLLKLAGYNSKDVVLNPHCNSGMIEIEAALYANKISPRFYSKKFPFMKIKTFKNENHIDFEKFFKKIDNERTEKIITITGSDFMLKNIIAAKKNAKIAGVDKLIAFRRIDMDWMDIKFEEKKIDKIITFIPGSSAHKDIKALEKNYKEFFYQSEYIIKNKGIVVILCLSKEILIRISKEYLELYDEKQTYSGEQLMHVLFFRKKSKADKKES